MMAAPATITNIREQALLPFSLPTERGTLATGNHSLKGLKRFVSLKRKSLDDQVGCLKNGQWELSHGPVKNLTDSTGT